MAAINVTEGNFEQEVLQAACPVLVDFWAEWCSPCQSMLPLVEELAQARPDVKICKVNVDEQMALARKYKVLSIPTFLVFKNGKVSARTMGTQSGEELEKLLES